jgi:predicted transcriptional regulator
MDEREFKKLLIDLGLSTAEVARAVGLSHTAVRKYFSGELRDDGRRAQIRRVMGRRAKEKKMRLPEFWQDQVA